MPPRLRSRAGHWRSDARLLLPRGVRCRGGGRSSDSGLPPPPPSRPRPVASWRRASPLTAAGPSRIRTGFPIRSPVVRAEPSIARVQTLTLDLDAELGDTMPLWRAWLADAARVLALDELPEERAAAVAELDRR